MTTTLTLTPTAFHDVVAAAIRAPSLHNSQPWRFRLHNGAIDVYADPARQLPVTDPTGWGMRIACGAAAFNARLAMAVMGLAAEVRLRPDPAVQDLMVRLTPTVAWRATPTEQALHTAIARRYSNRAPFWPAPVGADAQARLIKAAEAEGAWIELVSGPASVEVISEIIRDANRTLAHDEAYRAELKAWTRPDDTTTDGVPAEAGGPSPEPYDLLPGRPFSDHPRAPGRDFEPEPLVVVLGTAGDYPTDQLLAGMALQRVLLTITDASLAASMLSQPIEVPAAREQLRKALGRHGAPQMLLRVGYGQPGFPTPRRDPAEVIDQG
jgi:hypothetical protein